MASPFSRCGSIESFDDDFEMIDMELEAMDHDTEDDNQPHYEDVSWTELETAKKDVAMELEPEQEPIAIASVHLASAVSQAVAQLDAEAPTLTNEKAPCSPITIVTAASCGQPTQLSPPKVSRSHVAKESLKAFYLARAKQSEERSKAFRSWAPLQTTPRAVIQPLKAPERYSVAVLDAAMRLENTRQAQSALDQFYARRKAEKELRAAWNRANEYKLLLAQSGRPHTRAISVIDRDASRLAWRR